MIADLDDPRIPKYLAGLELPVVGIGGIRTDCPWDLRISTVGTNNQQIALLAAEHLLSLGLKHFAFCGAPNRTIDPWCRQRRDAFVEHLKRQDRRCQVYAVRTILRTVGNGSNRGWPTGWRSSPNRPD